jgi:hypothetical protein
MTKRVENKGATAYPLQWPVGWARTSDRKPRPAYRLSLAGARDEVYKSLRLLGAKDVVVSSNQELKRDGTMLANEQHVTDPGVAVYWTDAATGTPRVIACDKWPSVRENVRAIGLALEGIRAIERAGASEILDRAFQGFAALPASAGETKRHWRTVLNFSEKVPMSGSYTVIDYRSQIESAYRALARKAHPDAGGSHEAMSELNRAREEALKEVG